MHAWKGSGEICLPKDHALHNQRVTTLCGQHEKEILVAG